VPPLLGAFYLTVGLLHLFLDQRAPPRSSKATGTARTTAKSLLCVLARYTHHASLSSAMHRSSAVIE
jgi:hypothetical protein